MLMPYWQDVSVINYALIKCMQYINDNLLWDLTVFMLKKKKKMTYESKKLHENCISQQIFHRKERRNICTDQKFTLKVAALI